LAAGVPASKRAKPLRGEDDPELERPVVALRGIGDKAAERLARIGITRIRDLLWHVPARYRDFSRILRIAELEEGDEATVIARVWQVSGRSLGGKRHRLSVTLNDGSGSLQLSFFNQPYLAARLTPGTEVLCSGRVEIRAGRPSMTAPEWEGLDRSPVQTARLLPIYPLTEGIKQAWLRRQILHAVERWSDAVGEPLSAELRRTEALLSRPEALRGLHAPRDADHLAEAQRRLAFDELLLLQLWSRRRRMARDARSGVDLSAGRQALADFVAALPFPLTEAEPGNAAVPEAGGQREALDEIARDLARARPMSRLLQGDVGCGKTAVAGAAIAMCIGAGHQAALMAPTEILAEQHFQSLGRMFEALGFERFDPALAEAPSALDAPRPPRLARLVGSMSRRAKDATAAALAAGRIDLVVGTHAVIQERVAFAALGLAVVDEQHRFGVMQRAELHFKGLAGAEVEPHQLVMTATPIPRTLALAISADLDQTIIRAMPPGRKPVRTLWLKPEERGRAEAFIRKRVEAGHQAFVVYPLVEASDSVDAPAAVDAHARLAAEVFPDLEVGLLHGRMRPAEKEAIMRRFQAGGIQVLVATSVIEVGVDVPNASVMLIEGAERFGLAQLHQFRGRVGRGEAQSVCLLLSGTRGRRASARLEKLAESNDGLELAELDLEQRGPGDFFGVQQSGLVDRFRFARLAPSRAMSQARRAAERILNDDPGLRSPELAPLARMVEAFSRAAERA
ncbi:MAG: ATP-dependent DNA helicase RecG, partial [Chloroflexi bacterium]|nr:ATP-dependent DNA helicase RecG [Chloroflexota bacterium]